MGAEGHTTVDRHLDVKSVRPIQDLVLLEDIEREKSSGGIFFPDRGSKGTECRMARVIAVGNGIQNFKKPFMFPIQLEVGDVVVTIEYAAEKLYVSPNEKYRLVRSSYIWAKVYMKDPSTYELSKVEPRFDSYLVEPRNEEMTKSGLIYLPNGKDKEEAGRIAQIVEVGPGRWDSDLSTKDKAVRYPMEFGVGDTVIMIRFAGADLIVNGKEMRLVQECDIKCGLEEK